MTAAKTLTPKRQSGDDFSTAALLTALESAWTHIRSRHPEIPHAVIVLGSGSPTRASQSMKWGHFASLRWQHGTRRLPEVFVSGEGLSRTPAEVLTTLIHEAAHALADVRNVKDTSRQGRYHNKQFAALARELGLDPSNDKKLGWSPCTLPSATAAHYTAVLAGLTDAMSAYRHPESLPVTAPKEPTSVVCECGCGRRLRLSRTAIEDGPVLCGLCNHRFAPDTDEEG